jgi:hypothetical protein
VVVNLAAAAKAKAVSPPAMHMHELALGLSYVLPSQNLRKAVA